MPCPFPSNLANGDVSASSVAVLHTVSHERVNALFCKAVTHSFTSQQQHLPHCCVLIHWVLCCNVPWDCMSDSTWKYHKLLAALDCPVCQGAPGVPVSQEFPRFRGGRFHQSHEVPESLQWQGKTREQMEMSTYGVMVIILHLGKRKLKAPTTWHLISKNWNQSLESKSSTLIDPVITICKAKYFKSFWLQYWWL